MKTVCNILLLLLLAGLPVVAQQDPVASHYMFNTMTYNPGIAGISGLICATAITRQQWTGFSGAPSVTVFNVSSPLPFFNRNNGAGLLIQSDNLGFDQDINISGSYSYHLNVGQGKLGIGLSLGMLNKKLEPEWKIPSGDTHTPVSGDPLIPENAESYVAFDAGFGLYYDAGNYYAAFSVTHINQPEIKYTKGTPYVSRHYYATAGYTFQLANPAFEIIPSGFIYSDGKTKQFTLNSLVKYNKKVWGGVSYRAGDAIVGMIGIELYNGLKLGYSYDFILSDISKSSRGSHEFMVNYCFDINMGKSPMKYKSIRFL
ncbi:MAG: type IX secretion system membrane protein PorP/SprF [Bacteroidales bacterium]|jgi:type IX secretion system PorP/SprF family membrane protein|nr:type IX secretion system membrane protein PorP/SprF [Bacteroidales bacterium]